jgi:hypothetical protein
MLGFHDYFTYGSLSLFLVTMYMWLHLGSEEECSIVVFSMVVFQWPLIPLQHIHFIEVL